MSWCLVIHFRFCFHERMSTLRAKGVHFDETWSMVRRTVRSVICMSRYGHTDKQTWQTRFFGLIFFCFLSNQIIIRLNFIDIYNLCTASPDSYAERLYEETKRLLEQHCELMFKVIFE